MQAVVVRPSDSPIDALTDVPSAALTPEEVALLRLLVGGMTNKAAAWRLDLGVRTVERRRATLLGKLGVRTLVEAMRRPDLAGLLSDAADSDAGPRPETPHPAGPSALFAEAAAGAACGFLAVDLTGRILDVNDSYCRLVGRGRSELLGTEVAALTHPDDLARDRARNRALFAGEIDSFLAVKRYCRPEGTPVPVHLAAALVRGADGAPRFGVGTVLRG